jgi:transposase
MSWEWDKKCRKLSKQLGTFEDLTELIPDPFEKYFHDKYDFHFFEGFESSDKLRFLPIPPSDNSAEKQKLRNKLLAAETKRYVKEITRNLKVRRKTPKKALTNKALEAKHQQFCKVAERKVNQLDLMVKTRIVKLNPKPDQIKLLKRWLNSCDEVYNHLVRLFIKSYNKFKENNPNLDFYDLAKEFKKENPIYFGFMDLRKKHIKTYTQKFKKTPYCILANAIKEFVTSVKSIFTKIAKRQIDNFELKVRDKHRPKRSLTIDVKYRKNTGPYPTFLGPLRINNTRKNNVFRWKDVKKDFKIVHDKYESKFYLHAPILVPKKTVEWERNEVASLDPGETKFITGYALNHCFHIGSKIRDRIRKRLWNIDRLYSKMHERKKRKWKYKRAIKRNERKIQNDRDELHHKMNLFLVRGYKRIVMPNFSSQSVSSKKKGLNPLSKRVLGKLSHSKMRIRLQEKCEEYSCHYIVGDESYTTITCGKCGAENKGVRNDKQRLYKCSECKYTTDRDLNGSRNILMKNHAMVFV